MPRVALPFATDTDSIGSDRLAAEGAGAVIGTTAQRALDLARKGRIPHWHVGRAVRFSRRQLEQWLQDGGTAAESTGATEAAAA